MPDPRAEFLLEVGFEEMPAPWLPGLTRQLRERFLEAATREHLEPLEASTYSTPRRLVLRALVSKRQPDREEPIWGPAVKVARDATGGFTSAASGFARKAGASLEELAEGVKDPARPAEKHLLFLKRRAGREAGDVLAAMLPALLRSLVFPKRMSWDAWLDDGKGAFPFGRPVRWLVALLDGSRVPLAIHEMVNGAQGRVIVESGRTTHGHRFLPRGSAGGPLQVSGFAELRQKLAEAFVVLDVADRRRQIEAQLGALGRVEDDHGLLAEWQDLVEHPAVVAGEVPAEFRSLPREVLETVLVHHQKYVPLVEAGGVARFAAVTNSDGKGSGPMVRNMQRVVVARLRDAAFFWAEDMRRPLASRLDDLAGVTFHQGLGTYKDKAERLVRLVGELGAAGWLAAAALDSARRAALLAKADLTTAMVREFPELQGIMGGLYLRAQGEASEAVAAAVRWHYHPLSIEADGTPGGALGAEAQAAFAAVSMADKMDTLAGYFGLGLVPTGSSDPYGLRRAAHGAIRLVLDFWPKGGGRPSLQRLVGLALAGYGALLKRSASAAASDLERFLVERLEYVLVARGFPGEEVSAVVYTPEVRALDDAQDCLDRLEALHSGRAQAQDDFEHLAAAFKRAKNILTTESVAPNIEPALFEHTAERELFAAVSEAGTQDGGYGARLRALAALRGPVDRFFEDVLVMAEDRRVRANRLALLQRTLSLFYRIADLSRLGGRVEG